MKARRATPAALEWISSTRQARVLHVFGAVCNLVSDDDQVLSVQLSFMDMTPFALAVDGGGVGEAGFQQLIRASDPVHLRHNTIEIGRLKVCVDEPDIWDPRPEWDGLRSSIDPESAIARLGPMLEAGAPAGGLSGLMVGPLSDEPGDLAQLRRAKSPTQMLMTSLVSGAGEPAAAAARQLAGLGAGLTPSGDDLIMGALHGVWLNQHQDAASRLARPVAEAAAARTTRVSSAWLRAAAAGQAGEIWHRLFEALANSRGADLKPVVDRVLRTGHSSGADALTGLLLYWRARHQVDGA